jgi:2-keto-4-pentenoate hydratase/2-oxohepta-3-ene-1,7-dioic acid hydratase in catechol pathway
VVGLTKSSTWPERICGAEARVRTPLKESYAHCPFREGGCGHGLTERESRSPAILPELIAQGADLLRTRRDLPPMHAIDLDAVRILPPVLKPSKMLCVGLNHDDHLEHRMHLRYRGGVALLGTSRLPRPTPHHTLKSMVVTRW